MKVGIAPKVKRKFKLVKWEMETAPEVAVAEPEKDPRCVEVIEWELDGPKKVTYKRGQ